MSFVELAVSPDGRFVVLALQPDVFFNPNDNKHLIVQVTASDSGNEIKEVILDKFFNNVGHGHSSFAMEHFPSACLGAELETNSPFFKDPGSCLEFSPDGQFLLVATQRQGKRVIKVIATTTWQKLAEMDVSHETVRKGSSDWTGRFKLSCFSPDGKHLAGITLRPAPTTSRGEKVERVAVVFELATGRRTQQIELGDEFSQSERTETLSSMGEGLGHEVATFSSDGRSLVVAVIKDRNVRGKAAVWSIGSWGLLDGRKEFLVSGHPREPESWGSRWIMLAPGGRILATWRDPLQVWDVPHVVKLRFDLDEGDKFWVAGNRSDAFKHYCSVLADNLSWCFEAELPRVYSRCVDTFAERGEVPKGRSLVAYAQRSQMTLAPETPQGKKLIEDFAAEQGEVRSRESKKRREVEAERLADVRVRHSKDRVIAAQVTKRQFIDRLKQTMDRGRIDSLVTNAFFEDYSFQDVFGEPDSDVQWVNQQRLILYRCQDGAVQLTVMYLGSSTLLQGINQY